MNTEYTLQADYGRIGMDTVREINSRLLFQSGTGERTRDVRPWQYVEMEYRSMGIVPPAEIPPLNTLEDAEIWMCLDERVNRTLRMYERSIAG